MLASRKVRNGSHLSRPGAGRTYRGSSKRIRRIKWQDHTPPEFVTFVVVAFIIMMVLISRLMTRS
jgi:hypothetical protein